MEEEEDARARATQVQDEVAELRNSAIELPLTERAQLFCARALDIAISLGALDPDNDVRVFIAANLSAAERLVSEHGEGTVMERWRKMLDDMLVGHLHTREFTFARLLRQWDRMAEIERRRGPHLKAVDSTVDAAKAQSAADRLTQSLRSAVRRGSAQ
jgi:hypothetical protein